MIAELDKVRRAAAIHRQSAMGIKRDQWVLPIKHVFHLDALTGKFNPADLPVPTFQSNMVTTWY